MVTVGLRPDLITLEKNVHISCCEFMTVAVEWCEVCTEVQACRESVIGHLVRPRSWQVSTYHAIIGLLGV